MGISNRLTYIAQFVTPGLIAADIGTDHGYVPLYLLKNGICPKAFAMDLSAPSLEKAREAAVRHHLEEKMICRQSDGFQNLEPGEADCAIISGMGGMLMCRILEDGSDVVKSLKELVLSPHRDADLVKEKAVSLGFDIAADEIFADKGKEYPVIKAVNKAFLKGI